MAHPNSLENPKAEIVTSIWFGLAAIRRHPGGRRRLRMRWLRLLGTAVGLGLAGWMMAALGLYFWWKLGRGYQDERFSDVLFLWVPANYEKHNRSMGEYFINLGDLHLKHGRLAEAMPAYRLGVMKVPDNLHGREMLSEFYYIYYKDTLEHSLTILEDGLPFAIDGNLSYVNGYLGKLQQAHLPKKLEEVCQQYLAQPLANPQVRQLFALNLASVYTEDGLFDQADATLAKYQLDQTLEGVLLTSRLYWEEDRLNDAPRYLEEALPRFKNSPNIKFLYTFLSQYYRDLGDLDRSEYYIMLRAMSDGKDPVPRIELLSIAAKRGDQAKVAMDTQALMDQFQNDANAMTRLASFATDQGDADTVRKLYTLAETKYKQDMKTTEKSAFSPPSFALLICEAYLTKDDYAGALGYLDSLNEDKPDWLEPNRLYFNSMRAIADYGVHDLADADVMLTELIKSDKTRPDTLLTIANRFFSHGALDQAQRLLFAAHHLDPHNQGILAQLVSVNLQLGNSADMSQNLQDLLKTRNPPLELLDDAWRQLGSDRFIFVPGREDLCNQVHQYVLEAIRKRTQKKTT